MSTRARAERFLGRVFPVKRPSAVLGAGQPSQAPCASVSGAERRTEVFYVAHVCTSVFPRLRNAPESSGLPWVASVLTSRRPRRKRAGARKPVSRAPRSPAAAAQTVAVVLGRLGSSGRSWKSRLLNAQHHFRHLVTAVSVFAVSTSPEPAGYVPWPALSPPEASGVPCHSALVVPDSWLRRDRVVILSLLPRRTFSDSSQHVET